MGRLIRIPQRVPYMLIVVGGSVFSAANVCFGCKQALRLEGVTAVYGQVKTQLLRHTADCCSERLIAINDMNRWGSSTGVHTRNRRVRRLAASVRFKRKAENSDLPLSPYHFRICS